MTRRQLLFRTLLCLIALLGSGSACDRTTDEGTTPTAPEKLPPLTVRDATPELLFTWIDEEGGTHTSVSIAEIPAKNRELVRIVAKDAGHGQMFYTADLRQKRADGTYGVSQMPRRAWETKLDGMRQANRTPDPPRLSPQAVAKGLRAIIYGAQWCGPCHQAKDYLSKKGVPVTEHDIDKHPRYALEMKRKLRKFGRSGGSIPVIDIGGVILQGYNPRAIDRAIAKAQKHPQDVKL
jgi:glutaredoxin